MKYTKIITSGLLYILLLTSCKKDDVTQPDIKQEEQQYEVISEYVKRDKKTGIYQVINYPAVPTIYEHYYESIYWSFDEHIDKTIEKVKTNEWHISFLGVDIPTIYSSHNSRVLGNNGTTMHIRKTNTKLWKDNDSKIVGILFDKSFDEITEAPEDSEFDKQLNSYDQMPVIIAYRDYISDPSLGKDAWAFYESDPETGEIIYIPKPRKDKLTAVYRLNDGRFVKFQIQNACKITDENKLFDANEKSEPGYLTFRYFISEPGSKNLNTKK